MGVLKPNKAQLLAYGIPLFIILAAVAIAISPLLAKYPELSWAITFDLTLTAPILFLVVSRKSNISKIRAIPIFVVGILVATFVLPIHHQHFLNYITTYLLPLVELFVLFFLILKVRKGVKIFKRLAADNYDFYFISKKSAKELFGTSRIGAFLASEISMLYYALSSWSKRKLLPNEYSNYKERGSIQLAGAFLTVILIETLAFHILLVYFEKNVLAWILTFSSLYTAIIIFAHIRALIKRPSELTNAVLYLKNGLIADVKIKIEEIESIELTMTKVDAPGLKIGNMGLGKESTNHTIAMYFKIPQTIEKIYGFTENCDLLLFHLDDKEEFVQKVKELMIAR